MIETGVMKKADDLRKHDDTSQFPIQNSFVIMEGKDFIVYDYIRREWHSGQSTSEILDPFEIVERVQQGLPVEIDQLKVPQNSAVIHLERDFN